MTDYYYELHLLTRSTHTLLHQQPTPGRTLWQALNDAVNFHIGLINTEADALRRTDRDAYEAQRDTRHANIRALQNYGSQFADYSRALTEFHEAVIHQRTLSPESRSWLERGQDFLEDALSWLASSRSGRLHEPLDATLSDTRESLARHDRLHEVTFSLPVRVLEAVR
ncbi:MAG: hypothetical protein J0L97_10870 [Alphaproteobacteria bacterium]|nr:hypothetical protein [Alphaproteobacteria bacterium]